MLPDGIPHHVEPTCRADSLLAVALYTYPLGERASREDETDEIQERDMEGEAPVVFLAPLPVPDATGPFSVGPGRHYRRVVP